MHTPARLVSSLTAGVILASSVALPASASGTTITMTVETGVLSVTAPGTFQLADVVPGQITQGVMSGISVNDARAGMLGWVASVSVSDFTGQADPLLRIGKSSVTYTASPAVKTGTSTVTAAPAVTAPTAHPVQTAAAVSGSNTARWDALITIDAPSNTQAGWYTATVVHSVL